MIPGILRRRRERRAAVNRAVHKEGQLRAAADLAISDARRRADPARRGCVTVAEVTAHARELFGLEVEPSRVAAMLRDRYALRGGGFDLDTDAYE